MAEKPSASGEKDTGDIVIDEEAGLIFKTEKELFQHFENEINILEREFSEKRPEKDFSDEEMESYEEYLEQTLDDPDEVWEDKSSVKGKDIYFFLRTFGQKAQDVYYIAACYVADDVPTFVYIHFASKFRNFMQGFRRGDIVYSRSFRDTEACAISGDSLSEGDDLAIGLCESMLKVRSQKDISSSDFAKYAEYREETIEHADEIWRNTDLQGNVLVSFIRDYTEVEDKLHYIVVTVEDSESDVHSLLFSFPTIDEGLVERYRHGENLQADEVVQESSH